MIEPDGPKGHYFRDNPGEETTMAAQTEPITMRRGKAAVADLVIRDRTDNERALATVKNLLRRERTDDEAALLKVLSTAIEVFESNEYRELTSDPRQSELIQFLLEQNDQSPKDLRDVLGGKSHVSEILSHKRPVGPKQALKLGKHFNISPVAFLQWPALKRR
jgi:antitoxin component HigA of HigAB toxin-antitoxin module